MKNEKNGKWAKVPFDAKKIQTLLQKHKFVAIALLLGLLILLWPRSDSGGSNADTATTVDTRLGAPLQFSLEAEEERIAQALAQIDGVGEVTVVLTLRASTKQEVAVNEDRDGRRETVTIQQGQGTQSEVTLRYLYPQYQGALVVAQGADHAPTRLEISRSVAALTGLRTDQITVTQKGS